MERVKIKKSNKSLKEWNAIIEALGQGKQSIIIRKYNPAHKGLFLYPTFSYAKKDIFKMFKGECIDFVDNNLLPKIEKNKVEIKYLAKIDNVIDVDPLVVKKFNNYHIWAEKHVKDYVGRKKAKIWVLRVYKMNKPFMAKPNRGLLYANLTQDLDLDNSEPVLSDEKFYSLLNELQKL